jgi:hypothetical protein
MNKIIFIDTKRNYRAKSALAGGLRAFHPAPGAIPPARSALACHWRRDPNTGRLAASWSHDAVEDLTHCRRQSHVASRATRITLVARAA